VRVALLITCIGDAVLPEIGRATVEVLERLGHEVVFPVEQTCCGQMHANSGYPEQAATLARRLLRVFAPYETVVAPSSSCVGAIREAYPALARELGDAALEREAVAFAPRLFELSEFLADRLGLVDVGATFQERVTYHPTCHSLRVARVGDAPLRLLAAVEGLELVELPGADECCGFGGTFALKNAETSSAMVIDKCRAISATGASVCAALDASCLMQIGGRLAREGASVRPLHVAQILAGVGGR
jgi:L-lactate dehydrogenase complex protein LldE